MSGRAPPEAQSCIRSQGLFPPDFKAWWHACLSSLRLCHGADAQGAHLAPTDSIRDNLDVTESRIDVKSLSTQERLSLLEEIWDSLTPDDVQLTTEQSEELQRRVEDMEQNPDQAIPWDEARRRIRDGIR